MRERSGEASAAFDSVSVSSWLAMPIELPRDWLVTSGRSTSSDETSAVVSVVSGMRRSAEASKVIRAKRAPGYSSTMACTSARTPSRRGSSPFQSSATMLAVVSTTSTMSVSVARVSVAPPGIPGRRNMTKHASSMTSRMAPRALSRPLALTSAITARAATGAQRSARRKTLSTGWKITVSPSRARR